MLRKFQGETLRPDLPCPSGLSAWPCHGWDSSRWLPADLHDPDNYNGVTTDLEPDILEWEVKWGLGSITTNKASGSDGIPVELFQILKDNAKKCCSQYSSKFGKLSSGHRTGKHVFIPIPKKGSAKECSNYHTIAPISHANKIMPQILQARLQQEINWELPDVWAGFRKGRGTRDQIANTP